MHGVSVHTVALAVVVVVRRLFIFQQVVGIDCVDDESKPEGRCPSTESAPPPPAEWTQGNPHYAYYCYYLYANLHALNQLRARR